jgi:head-tail adaptor
MIGAGKMNKAVSILVLTTKKDKFGSEEKTWSKRLSCKAAVYGFDRDSFLKVNSENLIEDRLQFIFRSYIKKILPDNPILFRIQYCCKLYKVLNVNSEVNGQISVLTERVNE